MTISKRLHLIWYQGWNNRPTFGRQYANSWENLHPQWEIFHWDEKTLSETFSKMLSKDISNTLDSLPEIVQKVDFWRLIILHYMGGVYVDLDFVCLKNFDAYLDGYEFVACVEHDDII